MNLDRISVEQLHELPRVYGPAQYPIFLDSWDELKRANDVVTQDVWVRLQPERYVYADVRSIGWDMEPVLIAAEGGDLHRVSITLPSNQCESGESLLRAIGNAIEQALS